jgi:hypothetical protein
VFESLFVLLGTYHNIEVTITRPHSTPEVNIPGPKRQPGRIYWNEKTETIKREM